MVVDEPADEFVDVETSHVTSDQQPSPNRRNPLARFMRSSPTTSVSVHLRELVSCQSPYGDVNGVLVFTDNR